ncbi:MAG: hypothetical protein ACXWG1_05160 [Usitatibacter sp.]
MAEAVTDAVTQAWEGLVRSLEARKRELVAAVRDYPTPIARCDDQLPAAIERRDAAVRDAGEAREVEDARGRGTQWHARARALAERLADADDERVGAASARLLAELPAR